MNKPEILTKRTKLRLVDMSDLNSIHFLHSQPESDEFNTLGIPESISVTQSILEAWIKNHPLETIPNYTFVIIDKSTGKFIGLLGFALGKAKYKRGEVWYKIKPTHWNKGLATEVLAAVIDFGFDTLQLHRIQAGCAVDNIGSIKVLEKVGMTREGRGRQILPLKTGWSDNFEYSILETDVRKASADNPL